MVCGGGVVRADAYQLPVLRGHFPVVRSGGMVSAVAYPQTDFKRHFLTGMVCGGACPAAGI